MIAETIARLEAGKAALGLKLVGGAAEFQAAAKANPTAVPAAFVFRNSDRGGGSPTYGRTRQKVATEISVVLVTKNAADAKGAAAGTDIEALRAAVRATLLGWSPAGCDPLQFASGSLLAFRDTYLWWLDVYRTESPISSA